MNRCKYKTNNENDLKYDTRKIGYCIPLHSPKINHYTIKELVYDNIARFTELEFIHDSDRINYPSITTKCYMKRKKNKTGIVIIHIINKW